MILTEEDARKKWCPYMGSETFAQQIHDIQPLPYGMGRGGSVSPGSEVHTYHQENRCIASGCMAWRWSEIATGWITKMDGSRTAMGFETSNTAGYCGLAGKAGKP